MKEGRKVEEGDEIRERKGRRRGENIERKGGKEWW